MPHLGKALRCWELGIPASLDVASESGAGGHRGVRTSRSRRNLQRYHERQLNPRRHSMKVILYRCGLLTSDCPRGMVIQCLAPAHANPACPPNRAESATHAIFGIQADLLEGLIMSAATVVYASRCPVLTTQKIVTVPSSMRVI